MSSNNANANAKANTDVFENEFRQRISITDNIRLMDAMADARASISQQVNGEDTATTTTNNNNNADDEDSESDIPFEYSERSELSKEDREFLNSLKNVSTAGSGASFVGTKRRVSRSSLRWFQQQTEAPVSALVESAKRRSSTISQPAIAEEKSDNQGPPSLNRRRSSVALLDKDGNVSDDYILKRQSINKPATLQSIPLLADLADAGSITRVDGLVLTQLFVSGFAKMASKIEELNKINVFPIPDGDTGANMKVCLKLPTRNLVLHPSDDILAVVSNMAADVLLNGQGNSGTILSHFFVSLAEQVKAATAQKSNAAQDSDAESLTIDEFAACLEKAGQQMDEAVPNPVEGTLLSVCRDCCQLTNNAGGSYASLKQLIETWQAKANVELAKTPDQLIVDGVKVLEKAGVVDSGAQGFVYFVDGMWLACKDELPEASNPQLFQTAAPTKADEPQQHVDHTVCDSKYRYCTEAVVLLKDGATKSDVLCCVTGDDAAECGDSVACVCAPARDGGQMVKLHIHSNDPQKIFDRVRQFSREEELRKEKVEDMYDMRDNAHEKDEEKLDLSDAKFSIAGLCSIVLPPKDRSKDLVTLPVFLVPGNTQEPIDARYATDSETCVALNAQRHKETATRYTTAASNPMQIKIELLSALSKGKPVLILAMSQDKRVSALGRNIMQAVAMLSPEQQGMVRVLFHGWAVYEGPLLREAMRCAREGMSIDEAYQSVDELAARNFFFCSFCSSVTVRKLVMWRPGLFPEGFTVNDGEFFSFGLAPKIREGEPWSNLKRAGHLMNLLGNAPTLEDMENMEVARIKATLKPGQALADVMITCVGRPDLGQKLEAKLRAAGVPIVGEGTSFNANLMAAATGSWGEMTLLYKVVDL